MTARQEARRALTSALLRLNYPTDSRAVEALDVLVERFMNLPLNAPDEEFQAVADRARDVQLRLDLGLDLAD